MKREKILWLHLFLHDIQCFRKRKKTHVKTMFILAAKAGIAAAIAVAGFKTWMFWQRFKIQSLIVLHKTRQKLKVFWNVLSKNDAQMNFYVDKNNTLFKKSKRNRCYPGCYRLQCSKEKPLSPVSISIVDLF